MAIRCAKLHRLQVAFPSASESDLIGLLSHDFEKEGWIFKTGPRQSDGYKRRWFTLDNRKLSKINNKFLSFSIVVRSATSQENYF